MNKIETLYHKQVAEFKKLFKQLGLHLGYKKARERDKLVELNRQHFLELLKEVEETVKSLEIYDIDDTPRTAVNMHGYNDGIKDVLTDLARQREIIEKGNIWKKQQKIYGGGFPTYFASL